ncbi:TPA: hypothetical protein DIS56_02985 [Candidatus Saccharibacteria bacterium]|nr:hypothetical protein [Candidatus Saccharibacteria bacterium]
MYFNKKYKRTGPAFQQRYKAIHITEDDQLLHITRYLHLNPNNHTNYEWSSLPYYLGTKQASWLRPKRALELFKKGEYKIFLEDYKDKRDELKQLKRQLDLADN